MGTKEESNLEKTDVLSRKVLLKRLDPSPGWSDKSWGSEF
jgi:hypothetical protein